MKVVVKPLNRNAWSGIIQYKNCNTSLAPYFTRTGRLYTGLSEDDEKRLGEKLRLELNPSSAFWITFHIKMSGKDLILDTSDPYEELKYLFLKSHKRVANGMLDKKATANFIIINEEEEALESNKLSQTKRRALKEMDKMTISEMRKCLRLYGHKADDLSNDVVEFKLSDLVEQDPNRFLITWVTNTNKDTEFLIQEAVSKNVLRKTKNVYKYGTDIIGHGLEDAISFLDASENQDLKLAITNETKAK
jgi:hypothetical protein